MSNRQNKKKINEKKNIVQRKLRHTKKNQPLLILNCAQISASYDTYDLSSEPQTGVEDLMNFSFSGQGSSSCLHRPR